MGWPPPGKGKNKIAPLPAIDVLLTTPLALNRSEFTTTGLNPPEPPLTLRPASKAQAVESESSALHDTALPAVTEEIEGAQLTGDATVAGDSDRSEDETAGLELVLGLTSDLLTNLALGALD